MTANVSIAPRLPQNSTTLPESDGTHFLVVQHLAAETDDGGVFFIQTGERAVVSNDVDQVGVDFSLETDGRLRVPLKVYLVSRQATRIASSRVCGSSVAARHGGVIEVKQACATAGLYAAKARGPRKTSSLTAR
jgi:hypothetical protein